MTDTMEAKPCSHSRTVKTAQILPPDANAYGTLFGGKLMAYIDDVAAIAAVRHSRQVSVTASTDSVDFINPVKIGEDRKSTRLNSSHVAISYAVFCLKIKKI